MSATSDAREAKYNTNKWLVVKFLTDNPGWYEGKDIGVRVKGTGRGGAVWGFNVCRKLAADGVIKVNAAGLYSAK